LRETKGRSAHDRAAVRGVASIVHLAAEPDDADFALLDLEPARRLLGYEPQDRWPAGLGFELPEGDS